jgi:hypothetical protein
MGNRFSEYGNKFSSTSIWNQFSQYGSPYSVLSAYNKFSSTPPELYDGDTQVGYLSLNKFLPGTVISPIKLELDLMDECSQDQPYRQPEKRRTGHAESSTLNALRQQTCGCLWIDTRSRFDVTTPIV